jgi:hypothetical protein
MSSNNQTKRPVLFIEIFPIDESRVGDLYAYKLDAKSDLSKIGAKLVYRLKKKFPGHWAWTNNLVVCDAPQEPSAIMKVIEALWEEQPDTFQNLRGLKMLTGWQPNPYAISEFVANGVISGTDLEKDIYQVLSGKRMNLGAKAIVERVVDIRGWVINNNPAISISIASRLTLIQDLKAYAQKIVDKDSLIGLEVAVKTSNHKGEIIEIVGTLESERKRLLRITSQREILEILEKASDNELVIKIRSGRSDYDYPISALKIILSTKQLSRFGIDTKQALRALQIAPSNRSAIVSEIRDVISRRGYINKAYAPHNAKGLFASFSATNQIQFGDSSVAPYNDKSIINDLRIRGLYRKADKFKIGDPIRVGIISAVENSRAYENFWSHLEKVLNSLGFKVSKLNTIQINEANRAELEMAVTELEDQEPDVIIAFFPHDFVDEDDDERAYYHFKSLTLGRGIPSQVVEDSTMKNDQSLTSSVNNIALGILAKIGNIPYVLANTLDFADIVVGIDVARGKKKNLPGSINATAVARVYLSNGNFMQYAIHDAQIEGETIPASVFQTLLPKSQFGRKRIIIHRDGPFRGDEKSAVLKWADKIEAQIFLVEIIKSGSPRIYRSDQDQGTIQPPKGSCFFINTYEAILVSSLPPFKNATPRPLHIRSEPPFPIEQAIESVLAMTNLHYGSMLVPRLPVTIHYSDKIAYMALKGIKPKNLEGSISFWT